MFFGMNWIRSNHLSGTIFERPKEIKYSLILGTFDDGTPLELTSDGSLMTIGGAGTGKTQSLVIPNLLNWPGPVIVLDIKPELWDCTAGYRAKNFGTVFKMNFTQKTMPTHRFNPFEFISEDPIKLFSDASFITELIAPPYAKGGNAEFWEGGGRNVLQASLIGLVTERIQAKKDKEYDPNIKIPPRLSVGAILEVLADVDNFKQMIYQMESSETVQCRILAKKIKSHLIEPSEKSSNILSTLLIQLDLKMQQLFNPKLDDLTSKCDWTPEQLRRKNGSLYIMLEPGGVSQYATMLRMILGVHLREYLSVSEDEAKKLPPILLMFDEMPQLGYMAAIEQAIDTGRSKGIKLWGFAQRLGQLKDNYQDALGLLGNCRVQTYLSPTTMDGLADIVSKALGTRTDLATGQSVPLAEPAELAGPKFKDKIIVTGQGVAGAKINKDMAYKNDELQRRMNIPPPD